MANKGGKPMSDAELHAALKRFEADYKVDGPLTDDQRQVRLRRLQKYQKKEQEQEEKAAQKREKEGRGNNTPRKAVVVAPQPVKVVEPETKKSRTGKRKSVAGSIGNVTLQLTPSKETMTQQNSSSKSTTTTTLVRTETVIQSPANNKKSITSTSSTNTACIEISVTDVTLGEGAANLGLSLYGLDTSKTWKLLAERKTTVNGDCPGLITNDLFERGLYKLHLDTGAYYQASNIVPVFPCIEVVFEVVDTKKCYRLHIDLGPYSYTTSINN